jgi:hypothetical protein
MLLSSLVNPGAVNWILYIGAFIVISITVLHFISRSAFVAANMSLNKERAELTMVARENGKLLYKQALCNYLTENGRLRLEDLATLEEEYSKLLKRQEQARKTTYPSPKLEFI